MQQTTELRIRPSPVKDHYVGLRLDDDTYARLLDLAESRGQNISEAIRSLINEEKDSADIEHMFSQIINTLEILLAQWRPE